MSRVYQITRDFDPPPFENVRIVVGGRRQDINRAVRELGDALEEAVQAWVQANLDVINAANDVVRLARRDCPVVTGRLRRSIFVSFEGGDYPDVGVATVGSYLVYARYVDERRGYLTDAVRRGARGLRTRRRDRLRVIPVR